METIILKEYAIPLAELKEKFGMSGLINTIEWDYDKKELRVKMHVEIDSSA